MQVITLKINFKVHFYNLCCFQILINFLYIYLLTNIIRIKDILNN